MQYLGKRNGAKFDRVFEDRSALGKKINKKESRGAQGGWGGGGGK